MCPSAAQVEVSEAMKVVRPDEESAKAKAADLGAQFQKRFVKAMEIFEAECSRDLTLSRQRLHSGPERRLRRVAVFSAQVTAILSPTS